MSPGWEKVNSTIQILTREIREVAPDADIADEGDAYLARAILAGPFSVNFIALPDAGNPNCSS
jgi:hypothetical protein